MYIHTSVQAGPGVTPLEGLMTVSCEGTRVCVCAVSVSSACDAPFPQKVLDICGQKKALTDFLLWARGHSTFFT